MVRLLRTAGELNAALYEATHFDGLCFLEVFLDCDDCNKNLLKRGSYVATANGGPPIVS